MARPTPSPVRALLMVMLVATVLAPGTAHATSASAGSAAVCVVRTNHTLWCWGENGTGQLGVGDQDVRLSPTRVGKATNWVQVAVGAVHTCGVRKDHTLWCWGANYTGALGLGSDTSNRLRPVRVGTATTWKQVAVGSGSSAFTCAVRTDHTLWCWGENTTGQLATGDFTSPIDTPTQVGNETDWKSVTAGGNWTCALKTDHTLWCWGANGASGYLGIGMSDGPYPTIQQVGGTTWRSVSAGYLHTCATKTDGTLWCWGGNDDGELAEAPPSVEIAPIQVGHSTNWTSAVAGGNHFTCATKTDHTLWCWGDNSYGQLGVGDQDPRYTPTKVGKATTWTKVELSAASSSVGMRKDGTVWTWGSNSGGQLGIGYDYTIVQLKLKPTKVKFG